MGRQEAGARGKPRAKLDWVGRLFLKRQLETYRANTR